MKGEKKSRGLAKGGVVLISIGIVAVIALLATVVILLLQRPKEAEVQEEPEKRNVVVTPDNVDEVLENMLVEEYVEPGYYSVSMNNVWHFKNGTAISEDAVVQNKEENTNDVYFDLFLADNEETPILQSPVIPRGSELGSISLDTPLDAGTYDCLMIYHLIDEDQKTVSTLRVGVTVVVET